MRLLAFIISLLLLAGTVDPTDGWLIALAVVTGIAVFRPRFRDGLSIRPAIDLRLASFVFATLLVAGAIEPTKDWLIGLTFVTGFAMVTPRLIHVDLFGEDERRGWCDWRDWRWEVRTHDVPVSQVDWNRWRNDFDRDMNPAPKQRWEGDASWS
jgi:hypothetical protein